jgi:hypothetical protein
MSHSNSTTVKLTTSLNTHDVIDDKVFVTKTFLYCNTCGKSIQENPVLCYMFIEFFCTEKCHDKKHKINSEKIDTLD